MSTAVPDAPAARQAPLPVFAAWYGAVAGAVSGLALSLMTAAQHLLWHGAESPLRTSATILAGGVLIAVLRRRDAHLATLDSVIAESRDPVSVHWRRTAHLTALSVVAVGFGGAVGPEAGLVAIVTELSAIVTRRVAAVRERQHEVGEFGSAAVLGGLYGSPPAGATWSGRSSGFTLPHLVAGAAGFLGFLAVRTLTGGHSGDLGLPAVDGGDAQLLWALLPATAGAAVAGLFALGQPLLGRLVERVPGPGWAHTVGLSALVAVLAAWVPLVRFSGHEEMSEVGVLIAQGAWVALLAVAVLKLLATALCVTGGWLGGAIFPLLFAGAAAGAACLGVADGLDPGTAVVAGLTAAAVVGLRRPLAATLLCGFLVSEGALAVIVVGALVGTLACRLLPEPEDGGH